MENYKQYSLETFKRLISRETTSNDMSKTYPSTETQLEFGKYLINEMKAVGLINITQDKYGYVIGELGNPKGEETIGLIAHIDTSPDCSGKDIDAVIHENYDCTDINLKGVTISPKEFPSLNNYKGKTIITSNGTTLLGADDKAGICAILTAMKYFNDNPAIEHKRIKVAFTPDEEIGKGTEYFSVDKFACDYAYTIDGGEIGELNYETFNAARAIITITGKNVHPGSAKGIMINSALIGVEFASMLPDDEIPAKTEDREGFYHLTEITGNVEKTILNYIIRDFDKTKFESRKNKIKEVTEQIKAKYGDIIELNLYDEYQNMYEVLKDKMEIVEIAKKAMEEAKIEPKIVAVRGGTDGAHLSFNGLPCPNIFAGGHNFHGPYEYLPLESMLKSAETIINICKVNK